MGLFSNHASYESNIDFKRLREDLMDEYGAQMVSYSGALGYSDMCDAQDASEERLVEMAKKEGFNLEKYKKV